MKVILRSTDLSYVESARMALDAHDIPTVLSNENAAALPSSPPTLSLVEDDDFDRAVAIIGALQRSSPKQWWAASWAPRAVLILFLILLVAVCGIILIG